MAAASATAPVADCTIENATSAVSGRIDSASASRGTVRTRRSRPAWRKGRTIDENSHSGRSTSEPTGSDAAMSAAATEAWDPIATRPASTPTSAAKCARVRSTAPE